MPAFGLQSHGDFVSGVDEERDDRKQIEDGEHQTNERHGSRLHDAPHSHPDDASALMS